MPCSRVLAVVLVLVLALATLVSACTETSPAPAASAAPVARATPIAVPPTAATQGDTNARDLHVVVHLQGADAHRWLVADFEGCAMPATLVGCVVASPTESCGAGATRVRLSDAESARLAASIASLGVPDTCDSPPASDRAYRVDGHPGGAAGHLPPAPPPWREGMGECGVPWAVSAAVARLAPR